MISKIFFLVFIYLFISSATGSYSRKTSSIVRQVDQSTRERVKSRFDTFGLWNIRGGAAVRHIENSGQFEEILDGSGDHLVVVDFSATWCMPCKMIAPVFGIYI